MEETKEELGLKKTGERTSEKKSDEALKFSDYMDTARGLAGLARDNYIAGVQLCMSIWEANLEIIRDHNERLIAALNEQANLYRDIFSQFQTDAVNFWTGDLKNQIGNITSFQKNYYDWVIKTSDKFMKESLQVTQRTIEQTFINFDQHLKTY